MECFSIQEGREEISLESCMVLTDQSPYPAVFCRSQESKAHALARGEEEAGNEDDLKLRHVKDGSQWRAFNGEYWYFECDARNIVLGACTDGMNPFGNQNTNHSTWPVFVWMYNLPPGCA